MRQVRESSFMGVRWYSLGWWSSSTAVSLKAARKKWRVKMEATKQKGYRTVHSRIESRMALYQNLVAKMKFTLVEVCLTIVFLGWLLAENFHVLRMLLVR
jgi:hypothetical protein